MAFTRYEITLRYRANNPEWVKSYRQEYYIKNIEDQRWKVVVTCGKSPPYDNRYRDNRYRSNKDSIISTPAYKTDRVNLHRSSVFWRYNLYVGLSTEQLLRKVNSINKAS